MPRKPATVPAPFALTNQEAAQHLAISKDTLERYRNNPAVGWLQGVHWFYLPGGGIRWNRELLEDWLANQHDPDAHLQAIEEFRRSLPSGRAKRRPP